MNLMMALFSLFTLASWGLAHLLCHRYLLQGCSELLRHHVLPDGDIVLVQLLRIRRRAMCGSVDMHGNLVVLFFNGSTALPRSVRGNNVPGLLPPWRFLVGYCETSVSAALGA